MQETSNILGTLWDSTRPWAEGLAVLGMGAVAGLVAVFVARLALRLVLARQNPALAETVRQRWMGVLA